MDFTWASLHDGGVTKRSNAVKRSNKKTSSGTILLKVSDSVTFFEASEAIPRGKILNT